MSDLLFEAVVLSFVIAAAVSDAIRFEIPDRISVAIVIVALASIAVKAYEAGPAGLGPLREIVFFVLFWKAFLWHAAAGSVTLVLLVGVALLLKGEEAIGGGDIKIMASLALFFGFGPSLVLCMLGASVAGYVLLLFTYCLRRWPQLRLAASAEWVRRAAVGQPASEMRNPIPFAVAIAFGVLVAICNDGVVQ